MRLSLALATLLASFCTTASFAAPLYFHVTMKGGNQSPSHPLARADIRLIFNLDPSKLTPLTVNNSPAYRGFIWPTSNTKVLMDVSGSASSDGRYMGNLKSVSPTAGWFYTEKHPSYGASIRLPAVNFNLGANAVTFDGLAATFADDYFKGTDMNPSPFTREAATWSSSWIGSVSPRLQINPTSVNGFATAVPEPCSATLAAMAAISWRRLRRRS